MLGFTLIIKDDHIKNGEISHHFFNTEKDNFRNVFLY
jgi:hypothetical protein